MSRFSAKMRKLVNHPGLFFRDMVAKRAPGHSLAPAKMKVAAPANNATAKPAAKAASVKASTAAPVAKAPPKPIASPKAPVPPKATAAPKKPGPFVYYVENYSKTRVDEKLVFFDAFWGRKVGCHPYAIYRAMRADERFSDHRFVWVRNKGVRTPDDVLNDPRVKYVEHASLEHADALLRAGILVHNSNLPPYFTKKRKQVAIATWHGVPLKTLGFDANPTLAGSSNTQRNFLFSDHIIVAGDYAKEKTVNSYGASASLDKARIVGSPRIDLTLAADPITVREELGIHDDRKILLFAPTWRGMIGNVSDEVADQIAAVAVLERAFSGTHHILVSLHHLTRKALADRKVAVKHVPDHIDINEILAATDTLVSDYSSIFIDYLALNRPIILFVPDREQYEDERGLYLPLEKMPAAIAYDFGSLEKAVRAAQVPSSFETYEEIRSLFIPHEDGCASLRCLNILAENVATFSEDNRKKRIVIHPGGLLNNGITSSFLSLMRNFDYDKADVFVVMSDADLDQDQDRYDNLRRIDPRCHLLLRTGITGVPPESAKLYQTFIKGQRELSEHELSSVLDIFELEARRVFCGLHFDVAIDFSGYSPFWSLLMSRARADLKIAYQHSDMMSELSNPEKMKASLRCVFQTYRYYDRLISVSPESCEHNRDLLSSYGRSDTVFSFARNSISPERIRTQAAEPISLTAPLAYPIATDSGVYKFISIGRLSPEKNQTRLICAFAELIQGGQNAILFIVGAGPTEAELRTLVSKLRISNRVIFTGHLANPFPLLRTADCLVFPSDYEGQGLVLLEALTLGVPCVATDFPASKSILQDGDGLVCTKSPKSMAAAMLKMMQEGKRQISFQPEIYTRQAMTEFYTNALGCALGEPVAVAGEELPMPNSRKRSRHAKAA